VVVGFVVLAMNEVDITWITNFHHHHSRLYIIWSAKKMTGSWQRAPLPLPAMGGGTWNSTCFAGTKDIFDTGWTLMTTTIPSNWYRPCQELRDGRRLTFPLKMGYSINNNW
jgi:hypothetical protein